MEDKPVIEHFLATKTEEAFCALFELVCVRVRRYFLMRGLDTGTAEELTQNVLLKVYRQSGELRGADHFYGWLFTIARNEMISYWRGKQTRIETVGFESVTDESNKDLSIEDDMTSGLRLMEWLKALDPADRDLVVLRFVEGLSYEELAEALNLPLGTVKWRIFNARKKLLRVIDASATCQERQRIN